MHIVIFHDQHPNTLGGAQLSILLQAKYLERLGHLVTICAPNSKGLSYASSMVAFKALTVDAVNGYVACWPTKTMLKKLDAHFTTLPPVDIVHVQADLWSASLGFGFAKRHKVPTVMTFHTNVAVGNMATLGWFARPFNILLSVWLKRLTGTPIGRRPWDAWLYLKKLGALADVRIAPTSHFAQTLREHGVQGDILSISNGLDDDVIAKVTTTTTVHARPLILWTGRFTYEKRVMEFLEAIASADVGADVAMYGGGMLFAKAREFIRTHKLEDKVRLVGTVSSVAMLEAIANADLLVQTSIGYETQGRTVLEAIVLGTRVVSCDQKIVADYPSGWYWVTKDASVESLVNTLQLAIKEVVAHPNMQSNDKTKERYLQSSLTRELLKVYTRLT